MRLPFVFMLLSAFTAAQNTSTTTAPTTTAATKLNKLCFYLNNLTLNGVQFKSSQLAKWVQTEGIFYVYNAIDSRNTFKSKKFPIFAQKQESSELEPVSPSTTFSFVGDESFVGCWIEPDFYALNIRFKLYELYHTAFKAVSNISITNFSQTASMALNTLPYQYADANVIVVVTLQWLQVIALPSIPPVTPPIDSYYGNMDTFDNVEITDDIITADKEGMDMENVQEIAGATTDWMFIAALCSSMLGLFLLIYICVGAYRRYGRQEYKSIPSLDKSSKMSAVRFGGLRKISLRNIGINNSANEEAKGIMHPSASASYTFDD